VDVGDQLAAEGGTDGEHERSCEAADELVAGTDSSRPSPAAAAGAIGAIGKAADLADTCEIGMAATPADAVADDAVTRASGTSPGGLGMRRVVGSSKAVENPGVNAAPAALAESSFTAATGFVGTATGTGSPSGAI
jgi:hypothetical protein